MQSQNIRYIARLDHLRFFAFLLVFVFHFLGPDSPLAFHGEWMNPKDLAKLWIQNGSSGVSLFLVLSGFLFSLIADGGRKPVRYLPFVYNRILRIIPLTTFFLFLIITVNRAESTPMDILRLLTLQLNTGHPWTGWGHSDAFPSGPIWTIAVEFQFYLLFPLIIGFIRDKGIRWALGLILLMITTRLLIIGNNNPHIFYNLYHTITGRLDQFVIGILAGIYYLRSGDARPARALPLMLAAVVLFYAFSYLFAQRHESWFGAAFSFPVEAVLWSAVIIGYLRFPFPNWPWLNRLLAWLGGLSFSLYLFHLPVTFLALKRFGMSYPQSLTEMLQRSTVIIAVTIAYACLTYYTIEKPFAARRVKYTTPGS